jgi:hypothetical protein
MVLDRLRAANAGNERIGGFKSIDWGCTLYDGTSTEEAKPFACGNRVRQARDFVRKRSLCLSSFEIGSVCGDHVQISINKSKALADKPGSSGEPESDVNALSLFSHPSGEGRGAFDRLAAAKRIRSAVV